LINRQVTDLLDGTMTRLRENKIQSVADVRSFSGNLVGHGSELQSLKAGLEAFLHERVYRHHRVMRMAAKGARILRLLFEEFCRPPELLAGRFARKAKDQLERTVCDYLSGMTHRYA